MLWVCVAEMDVWRCRAVDVSLIVIPVVYGLLRLDHLTNVGSCCLGANLQVIVQILKLVRQIRRLLDERVESIALVVPLLYFV